MVGRLVVYFWYRLDCSELLTGKIIVGGGKSGKASKEKICVEIGWELHLDWQRRKGRKGKQAKPVELKCDEHVMFKNKE